MCRLFGMSAGRHFAQAAFWLLDAPDSLVQQSHREPDGAGIGWFSPEGAPHVHKRPIAAYDDAQFARDAHHVDSRTFIAHVRFASSGGLTVENTHPFKERGRLFAHNGVIGDMSALEAELGDEQRLVHGGTDSERYFALVTREIERSGGDIGAGLGSAARWIAEHLPVLSINCILTTPGGLWALRYPETHELYVLEREPGEELRHDSTLGTRVRSEHGREHPLVVLASEKLDADPGWRLLRSGELLHVGPELGVSSEVVVERPPTQPLSLKDLSARARVSQAHPPSRPT
ncbi:MAG: class II glutamine amidotransferase [Solirubrobacteraceae bacterium]